MGSIVKTIGKAVKKVGKALKKIAPILLVAAAAYVGYGYMTGFQQGGWPQITEWGRNLVGGVSQGQTLSQAATAAGGLPDAGITTAAPYTPTPSEPIAGAIDQTMQQAPTWGQEAAMTETAMSDSGLLGVGDVPSETGLLSQIQDTTNTRWNRLMDDLGGKLDADPLSPLTSNYFSSDAQASTQAVPGSTYDPELGGASPAYPGLWPKKTAAVDGMGFPGTQMTGTYPGVATPPVAPVGSYDIGEIPHVKTGHEFVNKMQSFFGNTFGKAWEVYKGLWKNNPYLAMYGTSKIIQLVMAAMDDSAEKESYRRRHVMGFAPGNWDDLRKKYGGNLPTSEPAGIWAGEGMRTASVKPGPKPAGGIRTSAIDRKPLGLIGSQDQRVV
jgi:hypothetical protein